VIGVVNPAISIAIKPIIKKTSYPSILFLNRIKKYKGADVLIKGFKRIEKEEIMKDSRLYIAGDGDYLYEIKNLSKDCKKIKIIGKVSNDEKVKLMEKCWIFVNPSFKEGWGIVNIEANFFGMPVIGSNVGGIKDSVIDGKTGFLFEYGNPEDLGDKIKLLIKNKGLRVKMGKNASIWAKSFNWDKSAEEYLNVLKKEVK
jgi:glycosyltransferase involved in cell wall biosynthesis